jgi:hypothetical protein
MKNALAATTLLASVLLASGCEMTAVQADSAAEPQQRVYTTGSNIARRPGDMGTPPVATVGRDAAEDQINLHNAMPLPLPQGGH